MTEFGYRDGGWPEDYNDDRLESEFKGDDREVPLDAEAYPEVENPGPLEEVESYEPFVEELDIEGTHRLPYGHGGDI
ncbi:MAG TPA: hypothetical protein VFB59_00735 [Candidatus Saccharimonadales bacterium]|nr:hypothetical protein [Candidatus Saccharimonadales bacterium]